MIRRKQMDTRILKKIPMARDGKKVAENISRPRTKEEQEVRHISSDTGVTNLAIIGLNAEQICQIKETNRPILWNKKRKRYQ